MIVIKTNSLFIFAIFILSLIKLNVAPGTPVTPEQKIKNCVEQITRVFGDGDTRDHGKIAIEHFGNLHASSEHQKAGCYNTLTETTDYDDIYGYYLSFKEYLDIGDMPPYLTFCEGIIENLKTDEDRCVRELISLFGEDMKKALLTIFYDIYKNRMNPKCLAKTKYFVEPDLNVIQKSDGINIYEYPSGEAVIQKPDGRIQHRHPNGDVMYVFPHHNHLMITPYNEIHITYNNKVYIFPFCNAIFYQDKNEEDPENTINIGVLYIDRVQETYGLNTAAMPPPQQFCREQYT